MIDKSIKVNIKIQHEDFDISKRPKSFTTVKVEQLLIL